MHILFVEDNLTLQHQTVRFLRSHDHQVTTFNNALDAIRFARAERFDALLCDLRLDHGPSGLSLAEQIRNLYPACPIVMISSFASAADVSKGYDIEVDAYIPRPVALPDLLARLYAAVERRQARFQAQATQVICGPLVLDMAQRTATWHSNALSLTPAEFALLAQLAGNPERVFSVIDLCALTKATRVSPAEARNLMKQHFLHLRQKLSQNGKFSQPIENVRGQGYKWATCEEQTD